VVYTPIKINRIRIDEGGQRVGLVPFPPTTNVISDKTRYRNAVRILRLPEHRAKTLAMMAARFGWWKHVDWKMVKEKLA